ncbi:MAG: M23 family metallopeptidase [Spirochaetaceae bacterium]
MMLIIQLSLEEILQTDMHTLGNDPINKNEYGMALLSFTNNFKYNKNILDAKWRNKLSIKKRILEIVDNKISKQSRITKFSSYLIYTFLIVSIFLFPVNAFTDTLNPKELNASKELNMKKLHSVIMDEYLNNIYTDDLLEESTFSLSIFLDHIVSDEKVNLEKFPIISPFRNNEKLKRIDYGNKINKSGVRIINNIGAEVYSTSSGTIISIINQKIVIKHEWGVITEYINVSGTTFKVEDFVKQGDIIGSLAKSDDNVSSYLEYRISLEGQYINPEKLLK